MILSISNLSYSYAGSSMPALAGVSATFSKGWTGIVGNNGAGKSTLLRLACGDLTPDGGSVTPRLAGAYCAQSTERAPQNLEDFALDYSSDAVRLRATLGLDDEWPWRFETLSPGERKRLQIACALWQRPPVLALDEPTNHLDVMTRHLLLDALKAYHGVGLLVSHDRFFIDELAYQCCFLDEGVAVVIPGGYTQAKTQQDRERKAVASERRRAREEVLRVGAESARRKAEADRAASRRSARHLDKGDRDGRARIRLAVVSGQDGKAGLLSAQMGKKMEDAQERLARASVKRVYDGALELHARPADRKVLVREPAGCLSLGEGRILKYPAVALGNRDRVGLRGCNGVGKSTFLNHLLAGSSEGQGVISIPQEMDSAQGRSVLEGLRGMSQGERGHVLSIVARLNSSPDRILAGDELSPGELRKVMLACGLLGEPHLIVMDEPTNHLDIHSIEALQDVLGSCDCALVLVSHDEQFLDALTDITWVFEEEPQRQARGDVALTVNLR